jgi:endonuclease/exonuclease/phosphatase family metal-dependent hydrolase
VRARVVIFWGAVVVLLLPAALLTIARGVGPGGGFWIRLQAFTPFGLLLYGGALVLLAVALARRRRLRSPAAVVAVAAVLGLAVHAWWYSPQVTGANPPPAAGAEPLVVMTANIVQGGGDGIELVRRASEEQADLLVVQEIAPADLADMERAGLDELLPYRAGTPGAEGEGVMLFARTELETVEELDTWHDAWVADMGDLRVIGVHPWAPTEANLWRDDFDVVQRAVAEHEPDLVVGDFNATADHEPMRALADAGYRDAGELANGGWQPTWPSAHRVEVFGIPVPSLVQIDHVLVGPRLASLGMSTLALPGSDHRVVVARVAAK